MSRLPQNATDMLIIEDEWEKIHLMRKRLALIATQVEKQDLSPSMHPGHEATLQILRDIKRLATGALYV